MKRIKMSIFKRMQNFLYLPDGELFWTSATLTIPQKLHNLYLMICCWFRGVKYEKKVICNTSRGYTLPWHGQMLRYDDGCLVRDWHGYAEYYDIDTGEFIRSVKANLYDYPTIKGYCPSKHLQGLSFKDGKFDYAYFGNRGKDVMHIIDVESGMIKHHFSYIDFCESHWKSWEAEGLQHGLDGGLVIGISVKTKFFSRHLGAILNYTHKV